MQQILFSQVNPTDIINSTTGRSESSYLAIMVLLFSGVIIVGAGYIMMKWLPSLVQAFRDEMQKERDFHQKQIDNYRIEHKEDVDRILKTVEKINCRNPQ